MASNVPSNLRLEIGHVLFIDLIGYSKLLIEEQMERIRQLTEIVLATAQVREATNEQLVRLPTGDGMALVFRNNAEEPAQCALQIARALKEHPEIPVRMGVHSGPITDLVDVDGRANVVGAGINMAQRVMDCGDAGHILLSKHVAEDLEQYAHWQPFLHDLGECDVKHGIRLHLVNLADGELGNPRVPRRLHASADDARTGRKWKLIAAAAIVAALAVGAASLLMEKRSQSSPRAGAVPFLGHKSIAVLPFANLSGDPNNAFFTYGVHDLILTDLARIADLKVTSRISVMQYQSGAPRNLREIGQQLGVAHVLEGSVQRAGNRVRVNAQLIDVSNDAHLWGQSYDRELADVFAIQSEIAQAIAEQLRAQLSPEEKAAIKDPPTADLVAFEQYSRARVLLVTGLTTSQGKRFLQAAELLNGAVARDPSFYAALCQLVFVNDSLYSFGYDHTPARLAAAETALRSATQLRPDSPETHLVRGWHLYYGFRDYQGALAELEIAALALPHDARILEITGYILRRQGKHDEGLHALEQAVALDPRNVFVLAQTSLSYQLLRRYPDEKATMDRILAITPDDVPTASSRAGVDLLWRGDPRPLHQLIERLRVERPATLGDAAPDWLIGALAERDWPSAEEALTALGDNEFLVDWTIRLSRRLGEGVLARAMGDEGRARTAFTAARLEQEKIVQQQTDYGPALCVLGLIDAALGNKDAALAAARRATELVPAEKGINDRQRVIAYCAIIAAWAGEKDLALQQLEPVASTPGASTIASYGMLKLSPFWDPLRDDPRFEQIVASLAPREAN